MGEGFSTLLQRVVPIEAWGKNQCGPTLRKLFGAYRNPDYWACYRRFRALDDGDGYLSYEELLQVISMQEFNLLFLWDNFSQQNELMPAVELMTVMSVFSSASLFEKGKFLMAVFDESHTGLNTGMEIARIMFNVLSVLAKCTGERIKQREVTAQLKGILPELLPTYAEELEQKYNGKNDHAFSNARIIGQIELEKLLPAFQSAYEALPVAGPAPEGACLPPPPDWAETVGERRPATKSGKQVEPDATQGVVKLTQDDIAHLEWMSGMVDAEDEEGKENLIRNAQREAAAGAPDVKKAAEPAQRWMVIYGSDFSVVARNLTSFRIRFIKSVSSALALPQGCIVVENVSRGPGRAVVVAFFVHPTSRNGDARDGAELAALLEQQLILTHSALRKGAFKEYCASAELFDSAPDPMHWPPQPMDTTMRATPTGTQQSKFAGTLSDDSGADPTLILSEMLAEAKSDLETMRRERDDLKKQLNGKGADQKEASTRQEASAELEAMRKRAADAEMALEEMQQRAEAAEKECDSLRQYIDYLEEGQQTAPRAGTYDSHRTGADTNRR